MIAGVATGAIGIGMLVAHELNKPFIYVRSNPKGHGRKNMIEGYFHESSKVVVIEDLISTGSSSLKACNSLKNEGLNLQGMVSIFNYDFELSKNNFLKTLKSIQKQTYKNFEIIVIDGNSSDGTIEEIKKRKKIISKYTIKKKTVFIKL